MKPASQTHAPSAPHVPRPQLSRLQHAPVTQCVPLMHSLTVRHTSPSSLRGRHCVPTDGIVCA